MDQYDKVMLALQSGDYWVDTDAGEVCSNKSGTWKRLGKHSASRRYPSISLTYKGGVVHVNTHLIVWMAARGRIPEGLEVDHKDNDQSNNRVDNLQLLTHAENIQKNPGYHSGLAIEDVEKIRSLYAGGGVSVRKLAVQFGISSSAVFNIVTGASWSNV